MVTVIIKFQLSENMVFAIHSSRNPSYRSCMCLDFFSKLVTTRCVEHTHGMHALDAPKAFKMGSQSFPKSSRHRSKCNYGPPFVCPAAPMVPLGCPNEPKLIVISRFRAEQLLWRQASDPINISAGIFSPNEKSSSEKPTSQQAIKPIRILQNQHANTQEACNCQRVRWQWRRHEIKLFCVYGVGCGGALQ